MASRSLTFSQEIDVVINECGTAEGPNLGKLKSILTRFRSVAQNIENGQFLEESKAEIAALNARIAKLNEMHDAELQNSKAEKADLEAMIEKANVEINRLQEEERAKKKEYSSDAEKSLLAANNRAWQAETERDYF